MPVAQHSIGGPACEPLSACQWNAGATLEKRQAGYRERAVNDGSDIIGSELRGPRRARPATRLSPVGHGGPQVTQPQGCQ